MLKSHRELVALGAAVATAAAAFLAWWLSRWEPAELHVPTLARDLANLADKEAVTP